MGLSPLHVRSDLAGSVGIPVTEGLMREWDWLSLMPRGAEKKCVDTWASIWLVFPGNVGTPGRRIYNLVAVSLRLHVLLNRGSQLVGSSGGREVRTSTLVAQLDRFYQSDSCSTHFTASGLWRWFTGFRCPCDNMFQLPAQKSKPLFHQPDE